MVTVRRVAKGVTVIIKATVKLRQENREAVCF